MPNVRTVLPLLLALLTMPLIAEDWPRFRGPNGAGTSTSTNLPTAQHTLASPDS